MPDKKIVRFAVLVLMVASFSLAAADLCLFSQGEHEFGRCPICTWVHGLAMHQPVECAVWLVQVAFCAPSPEASFVCLEPFRWLFAARPPPASATS